MKVRGGVLTTAFTRLLVFSTSLLTWLIHDQKASFHSHLKKLVKRKVYIGSLGNRCVMLKVVRKKGIQEITIKKVLR